jgi:hypothetical protein
MVQADLPKNWPPVAATTFESRMPMLLSMRLSFSLDLVDYNNRIE